MCYCYHGLAFHQSIQARLDHGLYFRVQCAGSLIKQKYGSIFQHHAGYCYPLALTTRKLYSTLTNVRIIAFTTHGIAQAGNKAVRFSPFRSSYHIFVGSVRAAIQDVIPYRAVHQ